MELKTAVPHLNHAGASRRHRAWLAMPGTGPAPALRRRIIGRMPGVSRRTKLRWEAGTIVPGIGPTARIRRRAQHVGRREAIVGCACAACTGAAAMIFAKRRSHNGAEEEMEPTPVPPMPMPPADLHG